MPGRVLLIGGSLNQTTMMHKIGECLADCECFYSPFFADGLMQWMAEAGMLANSILGGRARQRTLDYLRKNGLSVDYRGKSREYDLVITATDVIFPRRFRDQNVVLVQEGITDPEDWRYWVVRRLKLPRWLANTSTTGLSHQYNAFCVASEGYRELFVRKSVDPQRLRVTGIPNFDNVAALLDNDFPHRGYVLVATSPRREVYRYENRKAFIQKALSIANGRQLIFKLHPLEKVDRATREIERYAPKAMVFADGNTDHMIANCDTLVARYSSVTYVAHALNKEIHSDIDPRTLSKLAPIQNGGKSAANIAEVCREYLN